MNPDIRWKRIPEHPTYFISENGDVCSRKRSGDIILKPGLDKKLCHFRVWLTGGKTEKIHRLVGVNFVPNPHGYRCIRHKDGDYRNNNFNNLAWYKYPSQYPRKKVTYVKFHYDDLILDFD